MKNIFILLAIIIFSAYSGHLMAEPNRELFLKNQINESTIKIIEMYAKSTSQLTSYDDEYEKVNAKGVVIKVEKNKGAIIVKILRKSLGSTSDYAYLYENNFGLGDDDVAIVPTKDDVEYLKQVRTAGLNYDLTADIVLEKYKEWKFKYNLELLGAGDDWIHANINGKIIDWKSFAKEVAQFCPDVVYQGAGTVESLQEGMQITRTLYLWWD